MVAWIVAAFCSPCCLLPCISVSFSFAFWISVSSPYHLIVCHLRHARRENSFLDSSNRHLHELCFKFALHFTAFYLFRFSSNLFPNVKHEACAIPEGRVMTLAPD